MSENTQTPLQTPGSLRRVEYWRGRGPDGKYPTVRWGTANEQVREATAAISQELSGARHQPMELFTYTDDCAHINPEDDDRFDDVEGLVDAWLERNCLMAPDYPVFDRTVPYEVRRVKYDLKFRNRERGYASVPLADEWRRAQREYDTIHDAGVCLASPQGSVCRGCLEDGGIDPGDSDFGFEASPCVRTELARERQTEFWRQYAA